MQPVASSSSFAEPWMLPLIMAILPFPYGNVAPECRCATCSIDNRTVTNNFVEIPPYLSFGFVVFSNLSHSTE